MSKGNKCALILLLTMFIVSCKFWPVIESKQDKVDSSEHRSANEGAKVFQGDNAGIDGVDGVQVARDGSAVSLGDDTGNTGAKVSQGDNAGIDGVDGVQVAQDGGTVPLGENLENSNTDDGSVQVDSTGDDKTGGVQLAQESGKASGGSLNASGGDGTNHKDNEFVQDAGSKSDETQAGGVKGTQGSVQVVQGDSTTTSSVSAVKSGVGVGDSKLVQGDNTKTGSSKAGEIQGAESGNIASGSSSNASGDVVDGDKGTQGVVVDSKLVQSDKTVEHTIKDNDKRTQEDSTRSLGSNTVIGDKGTQEDSTRSLSSSTVIGDKGTQKGSTRSLSSSNVNSQGVSVDKSTQDGSTRTRESRVNDESKRAREGDTSSRDTANESRVTQERRNYSGDTTRNEDRQSVSSVSRPSSSYVKKPAERLNQDNLGKFSAFISKVGDYEKILGFIYYEYNGEANVIRTYSSSNSNDKDSRWSSSSYISERKKALNRLNDSNLYNQFGKLENIIKDYKPQGLTTAIASFKKAVEKALKSDEASDAREAADSYLNAIHSAIIAYVDSFKFVASNLASSEFTDAVEKYVAVAKECANTNKTDISAIIFGIRGMFSEKDYEQAKRMASLLYNSKERALTDAMGKLRDAYVKLVSRI
ncbi:hypothetical protein DB313_05140 (plasmid) [Borrelia turcica IST7]|uniref:Uncharacterized protein n=1 Tax=Borrelia turcica IST7 TaxID=1104446 RepID=A0A386PPA3_9SPIR|nr:hypothetical protein [Borrelia turcica]AYE36885.1 hypothetical protein DB313_05140 [Borrelia turcica IST7]